MTTLDADHTRRVLRDAIRRWRGAVAAASLDLMPLLVAEGLALMAEVAAEIDPDAPLHVPLADLADRLALTVARTDAAVAALESAGWLSVEADHAGYLLTLRQPKETHR